jgi:hypothetical protein
VNRISGRASKIAVALLLWIPFARVCHADSSRYDWQKWGAVSDTLRATAQGGRLELTSAFILESSERVAVDGIALDRGQYEINYQRGLVRIKTPLAVGAVVVVSYTRLPFLLNSVYSLREIEFAPDESGLPSRTVEPLPSVPTKSSFAPTGNLVFGGLKSISFSVGSNRSATFDQTLRASVEGDLTPTIRVKALLSDDNLPIQPEGNTQELEYLDKVYVEIVGPRAGATLGDIAYQNSISDYNAFRRELKGAMGSVQVIDKTRLEAAGGSSKGVFRSVSFRGTDQLQGPYELLSTGGVVNEVIIAGTEKVYFDGNLLLRGENRDYTIDYDRGTLTFTARRPVTADTEIAVDFQFTQVQYDRSSVFASAVTEDFPGGVKLALLAAGEKDDADRPKSLTLDENDKNIIAAAGDDETLAVAGGATLVGAGNGEYVVVPADTVSGVPEHFQFDDSTGTHDVVFTDVGSGRGDYVLDGVNVKGSPIFRFVGASRGRYIIGKKLPLPESHSIYTARLSRGDAGLFGFDLQYNLSDFDANTLSARDDGDNVGDAGEARLRLQRIPIVVGSLDVVGSVSTVLDRYRSLEKTRSSYFYRDWNLENDRLSGRELLEEIATTFSRSDKLKLEYQLGRLERDDFQGVKHEVRAAVAAAPDRALTGRALSSDITGGTEERTRRHGTLAISYGIWRTVPSVEYSTEEYLVSSPVLPDSGISYERYAARLSNRGKGRLDYTVYAEQRDTKQLADTTNGWIAARTDRSFGGSVASRTSQSLQGEVVYTHRIRDDKIADDSRSSDLARLNGLVRSERLGVRSTLEYEIGQNRERSQQKSVVFVGEGKGDYNELGEPVGKGRGAYTVVLLPTDVMIPTQSVGLTWNLSLKAPVSKPQGGFVSWVLANVSLNQSLSVREETTARDAYKVYLLFPSALQRDESTLAGIVSLRQDWSLLESYPGWSLTFRFQRDDEEENRYNGVNEERYFEEEAVKLDRSLTSVFSANLEVRREVRTRGGRGLPAGTGSTYDVLGWTAAGGWGLRLPAGSTFEGELELADQEDAESTARQRAITLRPRIVWHASKSLNVFGRYEVTRFSLPVDPGVMPIFFSQPGTTQRWSLTPNFRLSNVISLLGTYQGRSEKTFSGDRVVEHEFTVETRAYF